ncbi:uncharacterized protein METZ01_LOCUS183691 [marine metagenome]|uniref:Uncharacterized protein n=1 Tax=marine metagenome TaxID=408172 RepID=A0A382CZU2_9ZZZZ
MALSLALLLLLLAPNVLNLLGNSLLPDPNCVLIDHLGCLVAGDTFDLFRGASSL